MKIGTEHILEELTQRIPALQPLIQEIERTVQMLSECFLRNGTLYLCGNGGSASDCEHIAGELLKSFKLSRPLPEDFKTALTEFGEDGARVAAGTEGGLPVVSLCGHPAFSSAYANDKDALFTYAQQVCALGKTGDTLFAISTSGNSKNCLYAIVAAKAKGMNTVLLTGGNGGVIKGYADVALIVPEKETYRVQELHLPVYHCICAMLENEFFGIGD